MDWLWNWGGECFGYREGDRLFTYFGSEPIFETRERLRNSWVCGSGLSKKSQNCMPSCMTMTCPSRSFHWNMSRRLAGFINVLELNRHAARIRHGIAEDPAQAIGSAKELLETVLKTVIGDHGQKSRDDISELLKKAQAQLDLILRRFSAVILVVETTSASSAAR
jgi:hypothetical protein